MSQAQRNIGQSFRTRKQVKSRRIAKPGLIKPDRRSTRLRNIQQSTSDQPDLKPSGKRKRGHDCASSQADNSTRKRVRTSAQGTASDTSSPVEGPSEDYTRHIEHWILKERWPKDYIEQPSSMSSLIARKRSSSSSLRGKQSDSALTTSSDQKARDAKSGPYQDARYETLLATKGSHMSKSELGLTDASQTLCQTLLEKDQTVPQDSLFRDDLFDQTCQRIQNKNETRVIRDISLLIVPSAEILAAYGDTDLKCLTESVNEGWNNTLPVTSTRPQPDYSVGFRREAFTNDQLKKLEPLVGNLFEKSFYMATYYIYFPFLTCEVKCGGAALDVADRQNAHSMTICVRAVIELFRYVKREKELHRRVLAFSVSHDYRTVRIYGHYALVEDAGTTFYRHPIHCFDFTSLGGKERWTTYKFIKNVYHVFMPAHFKLICSVIDQLPAEVDFSLDSTPSQSRSFQQEWELGSQETIDSQESTPNTSFTQPSNNQASRKRRAAGAGPVH